MLFVDFSCVAIVSCPGTNRVRGRHSLHPLIATSARARYSAATAFSCDTHNIGHRKSKVLPAQTAKAQKINAAATLKRGPTNKLLKYLTADAKIHLQHCRRTSDNDATVDVTAEKVLEVRKTKINDASGDNSRRSLGSYLAFLGYRLCPLYTANRTVQWLSK